MMIPVLRYTSPLSINQKRISDVRTTLEELAAFPKDLVEIVLEYARYDHSGATLRAGESFLDYRPKTSQIKKALMSDDCDPAFKAGLFALADNDSNLRMVLRDICDDIAREGGHVILDDVILKNVCFMGWNLSGMSAIGAIFNNVNFACTTLTRAVWINVKLERCDLMGADMSNATLLGITFEKVNFGKTKVSGMKTDDRGLDNLKKETEMGLLSDNPRYSTTYTTLAFTEYSTDISVERSEDIFLLAEVHAAPAKPRCLIM